METRYFKPSRLINYTDEGGHWYQRLSDGGTYILTKEDMKHEEDFHIRPEHHMPGYDPIWCYNWKIFELQVEDELKAKTYFNSLSQEQLILIQDMELLYSELKEEVDTFDKMASLEQEVWMLSNPLLANKMSKCLAWKHLGLVSP